MNGNKCRHKKSSVKVYDEARDGEASSMRAFPVCSKCGLLLKGDAEIALTNQIILNSFDRLISLSTQYGIKMPKILLKKARAQLRNTNFEIYSRKQQKIEYKKNIRNIFGDTVPPSIIRQSFSGRKGGKRETNSSRRSSQFDSKF